MSQSLNPIFQNYSFIIIGAQTELVYSLREDLMILFIFLICCFLLSKRFCSHHGGYYF